jgi:hypothetical protein
MLQDIACLIDGRVIAEENRPQARERHDPATLAARQTVIIDKVRTIVGGRRNQGSSGGSALNRGTPPATDREKLQERLAKLVGSVTQSSKVGAATRDRDERRKRLASKTLRCVRRRGIVPGSGVGAHPALRAVLQGAQSSTTKQRFRRSASASARSSHARSPQVPAPAKGARSSSSTEDS